MTQCVPDYLFSCPKKLGGVLTRLNTVVAVRTGSTSSTSRSSRTSRRRSRPTDGSTSSPRRTASSSTACTRCVPSCPLVRSPFTKSDQSLTPSKKYTRSVHPLRVLLDFVPFVLVEPGPVPRSGCPHAGVPLGRRLARHAKGQAARDARQPVLAVPVPHHVSLALAPPPLSPVYVDLLAGDCGFSCHCCFLLGEVRALTALFAPPAASTAPRFVDRDRFKALISSGRQEGPRTDNLVTPLFARTQTCPKGLNPAKSVSLPSLFTALTDPAPLGRLY